jgi:thiaminase (transcriptional activator TenA)
MSGFTDTTRAEIAPLYRAILDLPFNRELAAGRLSRERFVFYMIQDAHYLGMFARALAIAAAKAPGADAQIKFAQSARDAIVVERALHEGFFRDYDVFPERVAALAGLRRLRRFPACHGLRPSVRRRRRRRGHAALLPDLHEVGKHLHGIAAPANP